LLSKFNSSEGFDKIKAVLENGKGRVHFIGVGGVGMYSVYLLTKRLGYSVSGSDSKRGSLLSALEAAGEDVYVGARETVVSECDLVVYSLAVSEGDRELSFAAERGIPAVSRANMLGAIMQEFPRSVAVSGSHGKSTVTAMLAAIYIAAGLDPSVASGAELELGGAPCRLGGAEILIAEACEYKDSFLRLSPRISVFTNLELDHTDYFHSIDDISRSFLAAMNRAERCVVNCDDPQLSAVADMAKSLVIRYAFSSDADFRGSDLTGVGGKYSFRVHFADRHSVKISLSVPGEHNAYNALAAFSAAVSDGIDARLAGEVLSSFSGIGRRFQTIAERGGAPVIYDYAHHPSEIRAAIKTAREIYGGDVNVVFRPHTATRTRDLFGAFVDALSLADRVYITELDTVREDAIDGVSSDALARAIGSRAVALSNDDALARIVSDNGALLILGAADQEYIKNYFADNKN